MMPLRSDTDDTLPTVKDDLNRPENYWSGQVLMTFHTDDPQSSNPITTALSPPPPPEEFKRRKPRRSQSHLRLRSDSSIALHSKQAPYRQYTHCNTGSSANSRPSPARALSHDGTSSAGGSSSSRRLNPELRGFSVQGKAFSDFFEPAIIKMAFSDETTVRKLRAFAETRHGKSDLDFLLKVDEYSRALRDLISSMNYISANFTGLTATSPLELSSDVAAALRSDIKYCVRSALPTLETLYQEARHVVEERLSQTLYPEFVKYQLAQILTTSLLESDSQTGEMETLYPGLGDAFWLTDPLLPDSPVTFASDGLLDMAGYSRKQLVGENCRFFQGIATDPEAASRLSEAVESGREATELVMDYRPNGTPYWNLVYICPLMENGSVRYFLGAQVCVSENMEFDRKDILSVLNFGRSSDEPAELVTEWPSSVSWPSRRSSDGSEQNQEDDKQSDKPISRRQRFFRRFYRRAPSPQASSRSRPSTSSDRAPDNDSSRPTTSSSLRLYPSPGSPLTESFHSHHYHHTTQPLLDERSSPYSRFLVMSYPQQTDASSIGRQHTWSNDKNRRHQPRPGTAATDNLPDQLPISFCSSHALSLLGIRPQSAARTIHEPTASPPLLGRDVFSVLSSHLRSPSASSRAFKTNVLAQLARGECVTAELMAPFITTSASTSSSAAEGFSGFSPSSSVSFSTTTGSAGGGGGGGGGGGVGRGKGSRRGSKSGKGDRAAFVVVAAGNGANYSSTSPVVSPPASPLLADGPFSASASESRPRLSGTLDKGAEFLNHVFFGSGSGGKAPTVLRRVVSRWVPLKDGDGRVAWVVLVLVPADGGRL